MARTTKQLSGGGKDKFLRSIVAEETAISVEAARRLGDALCAGIADVRVRREAWERDRDRAPMPALGQNVAAPAPAASTPPPVEAPAFDPFVFSAVAVLAKHGRDGLFARLSGVTSVADLVALAQAQHLTVDASVGDAAHLREAIVAATEARLAERRASAS